MVMVPNTGEERHVYVSRNLDDAPLDVQMEYAKQIDGMFVCPLDGEEIMRKEKTPASKEKKHDRNAR